MHLTIDTGHWSPILSVDVVILMQGTVTRKAKKFVIGEIPMEHERAIILNNKIQ